MRNLFLLLLALLTPAVGLLTPGVSAQNATPIFTLGGSSVQLQEVTPNVAVFLRSMRLNRAVNQWNLEVTVSNKTDRPILGPIVLLVDSFQNTPGPLRIDGTVVITSPKAFYDLSSWITSGDLKPFESSNPRTLSLGVSTGSPTLSLRVFAAIPPAPTPIGVVRTLNDVGQPLPSATLTITAPNGATLPNQTSDSPSGVASFGQEPGDYLLKFSQPGYLPVWRRQSITTGDVAVVPNPRLTPRPAKSFDITPLSQSIVTNDSATIRIPVQAGTFNSSATLSLTPINGQSLPGFLPLGWSPLTAFHFDSTSSPTQPLTAFLTANSTLSKSDISAWVTWNETTLTWNVLQIPQPFDGDSISVSLPSSGTFAWVVADQAPIAPPTPVAGQSLRASSTALPPTDGLTASGVVTPSSSPASQIPSRVTAEATVTIQHPTAKLPSGSLFRGRVTESYQLKDGSSRTSPAYEQFFLAYQRPGDSSAETIQASFPMRPLLLFGSEELAGATVRIEVNTLSPFDGKVIDTQGGQINAGTARIFIGANQLQAPAAFRISQLSLDPFTNMVRSPLSTVAGFELTLDQSKLTGPIAARFSGIPANSQFVLARVLSDVGYFGLTPIERLQSDSTGQLSSLEPATGERLPGLRSSGQYVLVLVNQPQSLISGIARNTAGNILPGMPVRLNTFPWLTLTDSQGRYQLIAGAGPQSIDLANLSTGDITTTSISVLGGGRPQTQDLASTPSGPRVASITPAPDERKVPIITSVQITFNKAVNPGTIVGSAIQLFDSRSNLISTSLSLDGRHLRATLTPAATLDPGTVHRVVLAPTITDPSGLPIEGTREFRFTTIPNSRVGEAIAEMVIYEPNATNVPPAVLAQIPAYKPGSLQNAIVVTGSAGTADPEVPVILVNESTGETATVLSKIDGSFASVIEGTAEDLVSATFVNLNGTRVHVATARQNFDNGEVGLYTQGGTLQVSSPLGPIQVTVPPNAISSKTRFKLEPISLSTLTNQLLGITPAEATLAGSAVNIRVEGQLPTLPLKVRIPVNMAELNYPADEAYTNAAVALSAVQEINGITAFQVMDQMFFSPDPSVAPPPPGRPQLAGNNEQLAAGFLDTSIGLVMPALGVAGTVAQIGFNQVLVPLLFGPRPVVIKGKVAGLPADIAFAMERAGLINQLANTQSGNKSIDVPWQLLQMMGFPNPITKLGGGVIQQLTSVSVFTFQQQAIFASKPLRGAFISVALSGGILNTKLYGRLFPGMVYATSGSDGYFLAMAPAAGAQYLVRATHPSFDEVKEEPANPITWIPGQQGDLTLSGVVWKNFFFTFPKPSETPPEFSIAHTPVYPAPGQTADIVIQASLQDRAPKIGVLLQSVGTTNLLTGAIENNVHHELTNIVVKSSGFTTRWTATLSVDKPVLATFKVTVQGATGDQGLTTPYGIAFTGRAPAANNTQIPKPDTNDVHGPLVAYIDPPDNSYLREDGKITVLFNKPIDAAVKQDLGGIILQDAPSGTRPVVELSKDQHVLTLRYPSLPADRTYTLTLSAGSIRDLAGQPMDQIPSTPETESFSATLRTPPSANASILNLENAKGSVVSGKHLFIIDQGASANTLQIFDLDNPLHPSLINQVRLPGDPRDITLIPKYSYKRTGQSQVVTSDLIAIVGGDLDSVVNQVQGVTVSTKGQYLWVLDVADPLNPVVLASPLVSLRIASAATKVRWAPPHLVYQEFGADIQLLGFVNLQEMIYGFGISRTKQEVLPANPRPGKDINGDGDYVDPGELLPIPANFPAEFYGKKQSLVLQGTTQKILDFSVSESGNTVGITLRNGVVVDENGKPLATQLPPMYRTWVQNGISLESGDPTIAMYPFPKTAYPRWVKVFDALPLTISNAPTTRAVALVTLSPNTNGASSLAVIDITLPLAPKLLNEVEIPEEILGGPMGPISQRPDGLLQIAGANNIIFINPEQLANTDVGPGRLHPAILGSTLNAGGLTRSLGQNDYGVNAVADGRRGTVVLSPPELRFVNFSKGNELVDPTTLRNLPEENITALLNNQNLLQNLAPAQITNTVTGKSDLEPPNLALHYHVLFQAPGSAGETIQIGLESLNPAGRPFSNLGVGFAPVRAISDFTQASTSQTPREGCGAPISALIAHRISNFPNNKYYNYYLSKPFALITASATLDDLQQWNTVNNQHREILFSGANLRAFIDPVEINNPVVGPFAARIDGRSQQIYPIASGNAETVHRDYLVGDNPPPPGSPSPVEDTFGTILSHSGELRTTDVDMSLPSPRMPIHILRAIGTQDSYEGPFGVGWDFNYNERLTILDSKTFPAGLQIPMVIRDNEANSDIAGSQDLLFNNGLGRVFTFRWKGTNMPPEYAQDPLVRDFQYQQLVSDYFLPLRGIFDLLVKFKDGRFERLTPDGTRYRYTSQGRLELIIDRYPQNRHELQYDRNGLLIRIDDRSVTADRYVELGHFRRRNTDKEFRDGLDQDTANPFLEGKICKIRDYAGRDVLFHYDNQGFLIKSEGVQVNGENGGFSGRSQVTYNYDQCKLVGISAQKSGTPIVAASISKGARGKPVATATSSSLAASKLSIPPRNSAANVSSIQSGASLADGATVSRTFDTFGHTATETRSGKGAAPATLVTSNTADGLRFYTRMPEGNVVLNSYDSSNPIFRSRGNLLSTTSLPGPRGGPTLKSTFQYDPRYNIASGEQTDPNGFKINHVLTSDGRDVATISYPNVGNKTSTYDKNGQVLENSDHDGITARYTYEKDTGFLSTETKGTITLQYSYNGGVASKLGRAVSVAQPLGTPTLFSYDNNLQLTRVSRGGLVTLTAYDELGRDTFHEEQVGDGRTLTTTKEYNDAGFLTKTTTGGLEVDGTVQSFITEFKPDERSRIRESILPSGTRQTYEYDARGNVLKMTLGSYTERYEYDLNNNNTRLFQGDEEVRRYFYDGHDRTTNTVTLTGLETYSDTASYYPDGQLQSRTLTDSRFGIVNQMQYDQPDSIGRHKNVRQLGGVISPSFSYEYGPLFNKVTGPRQTITTRWDAAGNQTSLLDAIQEVITERDANGRIHSLTHKETGATYVQTFGYNDLDHQTTLDDLLGRLLTYTPRADGAQTKVTNARNNTTTFDHSAQAEVLSSKRADGMEMRTKLDEQRQTLFNGDTQSGFGFSYDADLRLSRRTLRNGAVMNFSDFDARNMPRKMTYPGGSAKLFYDLQRRLIGREMTYQGTAWFESTTYDALGRIRNQTYTQNGGAQNSMTQTYDAAGPLLTSECKEDGATFVISMGYYPDGARKTLQYPSGLIITESRDVTGRLTGISDATGNILNALSWMGSAAPKEVDVGGSLQTVHTYDARGRLTGSRTVRKSDGKIIAHLRYQYDAANNLEKRQDWHRNGLTDQFQFDAGERLIQAQIGAFPQSGPSVTPPLYTRSYSYSGGGLDFLTDSTLTNILARPPPFAQSWTGHDAFLQPTTVDDYTRGEADPKGNVAKAKLWVRPALAEAPQASPATLQHDALGRLVSVTRDDGTQIVSQFQPSGLRFSRKVTQGGFLVSHLHYVYDPEGRLLEEYDRSSGQPVLAARYIYASGDAPVAADLLNPSSGNLERFYYLRDAAQSVVAIANQDGEGVERAQYDPFGQPTIQGRDSLQPEVLEVRSSPDGGALWIVLSESVWPATADPGVGGGIVPITSTLDSSVLSVATGSTNIDGTLSLLPSVEGLPPFSVLEFKASRELPELPSALNGWWPGDQKVTDVEAGHDGTLVGGATTGPGLIQEAFVLNGSSAYVQIPNDDAINPGTNDFTVALWVKLRTTNGQQTLIEKWQSTPATGWSLLKTPDNRLRLTLGGTSTVNIDSAPLSWSTNSWIQYAFRRQGSQYTLLTNGVRVATGTSTANLDSSSALRFGSRDGTSAFLNGSLDEITLFERAMSDAEITAIAGGLVSPGNLTVTLHPGKLADEWGNLNTTSTVSVAPNDQPNVVYYRAVTATPTAPPALARSAFQSPFLFQGQYFDYDTGLVYMRSRHYDPYSGMFLEPDPLGYESSVNHYAGLANNPVSSRDPMGLTPQGISYGSRNRFLRSRDYSSHEIHLINRAHHELSRLGMGDLEIAAHVRVMYKAFKEHGVSWEMSIRTFSNPTKRLEQLDRFHQTKEEKVSNKTQDDGLARYENKETGQTELFTGDLDGLYLLRNGQIATLSETKRFQDAVNAEVANLSAGWREMAARGGQEIVGTEVQKAYQHGVSLNIPQEYGSRNVLMKGGRCGIAGFDWIESKMKKGTGTAFSFKINEKGDGMDIVKSVDVNKMISMYENHYNNVMLNPSSPGFNRSMFNRRYKQFQRDWRAPATLYPKTFKGHNYGSPGAN